MTFFKKALSTHPLLSNASGRPSRIAWISNFPVERLPDIPESVQRLPSEHPLTWQSVLYSELRENPKLELHILVLRKELDHNFSFQRGRTCFHLLKTPRGLRAASFYWTDSYVIRKALKQVKPDLVHAWGTERGAALIASRLRYPYLVTLQGLLTWLSEEVPLNRYLRFSAFLEKFSLARATTVTTESRFAVNYIKSRYTNTSVVQIEHAPSWLFHELRREPPQTKVRFLYVGSLCYLKGSDILLQALEHIKNEIDFELILVGNADEGFWRIISEAASPQLIQCVRRIGTLSASDVAKELQQATMMILPSRADNSPNAVKEAVVAGVPVVASDVGGIPDYVIPGRNGILFAPGNVGSLTSAIRSACAHPLFRRGQVDSSILPEIRAYLSPSVMGKKFADLYGQILGLA